MIKVHSHEQLSQLQQHEWAALWVCVCVSVCVQRVLQSLSLWLCEAAGLPVYQRSSERWFVWSRSLQNRGSSRLAALRSSTCGGSTCCTLCGPAWANTRVFTYNVDFTYDLTKILKQAVFVLYISGRCSVNPACRCEGSASAAPIQTPLTLKGKKIAVFEHCG